MCVTFHRTPGVKASKTCWITNAKNLIFVSANSYLQTQSTKEAKIKFLIAGRANENEDSWKYSWFKL